jgi:ubiquinone/menaquinone biosynthesis C-methylase UbiE
VAPSFEADGGSAPEDYEAALHGVVAGVDVNPGMLAVARSVMPQGLAIDWHEGRAECLPFGGSEFGTVFCQLGLQFFADKVAALREMRRVVAPGGRVLVSTAGTCSVRRSRRPWRHWIRTLAPRSSAMWCPGGGRSHATED